MAVTCVENRHCRTMTLPSNTVHLIREALRETPSAKEELFRRYLPRVRQIVSLRMGVRLLELEEIEDVVQNAMLTAWRDLGNFEARSEGSFISWMARIVENTLRAEARYHHAECRHAGRRAPLYKLPSESLSSLMFKDGGPSPSEVAAGYELEDLVRDAFDKLNKADREIIIMSRLCGMSDAEIAREVGLGSASSARSRRARALARLARLLDST